MIGGSLARPGARILPVVAAPGGMAGAALGPLPLGVAAGLVPGKQIGVLGAVRIAVAGGIARLPAGIGWLEYWGVALLAGIGFTMSLFIGGLAFPDAVRIGVLAGSLIPALAGAAVLALAARRRAATEPGTASPVDSEDIL